MSVETNPVMEVDTNPAQGVEVGNDQSENQEQQVAEEAESENPDAETAEELEDELEEAEYEGKKYNLPKNLKDALLRQQDYTKKTQEVAETRKRFESEQQNFRKVQETREADFKNYVDLANLDQRIEEYNKAFSSQEWQSIIDSDPSRAIRANQEYQALQNLRNQKSQEITRKEHERSLGQQQHYAKLEEETRTALNRDIKGWGIEKESKLREYAKQQGIQDQEFGQALKYNAIGIKTLHKAMLYDQLIKKQLSTPKVEVKPIAKINSGKSTVLPNEFKIGMSHDDYDKWRNSRKKSK